MDGLDTCTHTHHLDPIHAHTTHTIKQALTDGLPADTLTLVKSDGVKEYSEQGWKVARNRKFGIGVKEAGDAHKATLVVESEKADALLPGV